MNEALNPAEREFLIQLRSLLLKCVDLIERRAQIGKYRPAKPVPHSPTETIAGAYIGNGETEIRLPNQKASE
jgi:hypothetical protein